MLHKPIFCAAAIVMLAAVSLSARAQSPVLLRMKFKPGTVSKYQTNVNMKMVMTPIGAGKTPGMTGPMTFPVSISAQTEQRVTKALPDGGGEIVTMTLSQQMSFNGQPGGGQPPGPVTSQMDSRGKTLSMSGVPQTMTGTAGPLGMMNSNSLSNLTIGGLLPARTVQPGDIWTQTIKIPGLVGTALARSKFVRFETIGAFRTARVHTTINMPLKLMMDAANRPTRSASAAVASVTGTFAMSVDTNLAVDEGKIVRSGGRGTMLANLKSKTVSAASGPSAMRLNVQMDVANALIP